MDNASINIDHPINNTWQITLLYPFENELDYHATTFLLHFLSLMTKLSSCKSSIHFISLGLTSFLANT